MSLGRLFGVDQILKNQNILEHSAKDWSKYFDQNFIFITPELQFIVLVSFSALINQDLNVET